ncbi:hypothetical protein F3Y22_tig00111146pilonHSYRG00051 [Hibiscus syriacus]|uniref:Pectinesterase inhibitor domain-containing protein n=1 Tax=Hibiscus syriacus TaxID=106335 RepID=A0A6A2YXN5_HIBSY|nr:hypothetical protein F3Y22_tig00111146pilonHSYRG00051 [Hibiscus syriacus]
MANQTSNLSPQTLLIITLISLLTINRFFHETGAQETGKALIESTCKKTQCPEEYSFPQIPSLANPSLNSDFSIVRSPFVDLKSPSCSLSTGEQNPSNLSSIQTDETLNIVSKLAMNETDYLTWGFLVFCRDSYNASVPQIQAGLQAFDKLEFEKSYRSVEAVNKAVVECDKQGLKMISQVNSGLFRLTKDAMIILDLLF